MFPADFPNVQSTQILVSDLTSDAKYHYRVRVLTSTASNAVEIPRAISGTFTSSSEAGMNISIIPVVLSSVVSLTVGALVVALITCCYVRRRGKRTSQAQTLPEKPQELHHPVPLYAEVQQKKEGVLEMKENIAYGSRSVERGLVGMIEIKENIAYAPIHVVHQLHA